MKAFLLFSAGFIVCAGAFLGLWRLGLVHNSLLDGLRADASTTVTVVEKVVAPNGEFVATLNRAENAVGWCELRLNVTRNGEAFDWEREYVSIAGCDTQLALQWSADTQLTVTYWNSDPTKAIHTYQQYHSKDSAVKISYLFKQSQ